MSAATSALPACSDFVAKSDGRQPLPNPMLRAAETLEARAEAGEPLTVKEMRRIAERLRSWAGLAATNAGQPLAPALPNVLPDNVVRLPERAG